MTIVGIDPGTATTGYGVVTYTHGQAIAEDYGCILTAKTETASARLQQLYRHMHQLLEAARPDVVAVEKLFFNTNITTAMGVSQARGIVLLAIEERGVELAEYTPLQVKMAVCGYGRAKKPQVQQMIAALLKLPEPPKPDDAADALAIALCHTSALPITQLL
jgi:crossover junction endodeoxyribonuclease RuvC